MRYYVFSPVTNGPYTRGDRRRNCRSDRRGDRLKRRSLRQSRRRSPRVYIRPM